jgi:hypothetical protein
MSKRTTLTAYGAPSDREKLEALAKAAGLTASAWIVRQIRRQFEEMHRGNEQIHSS